MSGEAGTPIKSSKMTLGVHWPMPQNLTREGYLKHILGLELRPPRSRTSSAADEHAETGGLAFDHRVGVCFTNTDAPLGMRSFVCDAIVAPAGAGKTTYLESLHHMLWERFRGNRSAQGQTARGHIAQSSSQASVGTVPKDAEVLPILCKLVLVSKEQGEETQAQTDHHLHAHADVNASALLKWLTARRVAETSTGAAKESTQDVPSLPVHVLWILDSSADLVHTEFVNRLLQTSHAASSSTSIGDSASPPYTWSWQVSTSSDSATFINGLMKEYSPSVASESILLATRAPPIHRLDGDGILPSYAQELESFIRIKALEPFFRKFSRFLTRNDVRDIPLRSVSILSGHLHIPQSLKSQDVDDSLILWKYLHGTRGEHHNELSFVRPSQEFLTHYRDSLIRPLLECPDSFLAGPYQSVTSSFLNELSAILGLIHDPASIMDPPSRRACGADAASVVHSRSDLFSIRLVCPIRNVKFIVSYLDYLDQSIHVDADSNARHGAGTAGNQASSVLDSASSSCSISWSPSTLLRTSSLSRFYEYLIHLHFESMTKVLPPTNLTCLKARASAFAWAVALLAMTQTRQMTLFVRRWLASYTSNAMTTHSSVPQQSLASKLISSLGDPLSLPLLTLPRSAPRTHATMTTAQSKHIIAYALLRARDQEQGQELDRIDRLRAYTSSSPIGVLPERIGQLSSTHNRIFEDQLSELASSLHKWRQRQIPFRASTSILTSQHRSLDLIAILRTLLYREPFPSQVMDHRLLECLNNAQTMLQVVPPLGPEDIDTANNWIVAYATPIEVHLREIQTPKGKRTSGELYLASSSFGAFQATEAIVAQCIVRVGRLEFAAERKHSDQLEIKEPGEEETASEDREEDDEILMAHTAESEALRPLIETLGSMPLIMTLPRYDSAELRKAQDLQPASLLLNLSHGINQISATLLGWALASDAVTYNHDLAVLCIPTNSSPLETLFASAGYRTVTRSWGLSKQEQGLWISSDAWTNFHIWIRKALRSVVLASADPTNHARYSTFAVTSKSVQTNQVVALSQVPPVSDSTSGNLYQPCFGGLITNADINGYPPYSVAANAAPSLQLAPQFFPFPTQRMLLTQTPTRSSQLEGRDVGCQVVPVATPWLLSMQIPPLPLQILTGDIANDVLWIAVQHISASDESVCWLPLRQKPLSTFEYTSTWSPLDSMRVTASTRAFSLLQSLCDDSCDDHYDLPTPNPLSSSPPGRLAPTQSIKASTNSEPLTANSMPKSLRVSIVSTSSTWVGVRAPLARFPRTPMGLAPLRGGNWQHADLRFAYITEPRALLSADLYRADLRHSALDPIALWEDRAWPHSFPVPSLWLLKDAQSTKASSSNKWKWLPLLGRKQPENPLSLRVTTFPENPEPEPSTSEADVEVDEITDSDPGSATQDLMSINWKFALYLTPPPGLLMSTANASLPQPSGEAPPQHQLCEDRLQIHPLITPDSDTFLLFVNDDESAPKSKFADSSICAKLQYDRPLSTYAQSALHTLNRWESGSEDEEEDEDDESDGEESVDSTTNPKEQNGKGNTSRALDLQTVPKQIPRKSHCAVLEILERARPPVSEATRWIIAASARRVFIYNEDTLAVFSSFSIPSSDQFPNEEFGGIIGMHPRMPLVAITSYPSRRIWMWQYAYCPALDFVARKVAPSEANHPEDHASSTEVSHELLPISRVLSVLTPTHDYARLSSDRAAQIIEPYPPFMITQLLWSPDGARLAAVLAAPDVKPSGGHVKRHGGVILYSSPWAAVRVSQAYKRTYIFTSPATMASRLWNVTLLPRMLYARCHPASQVSQGEAHAAVVSSVSNPPERVAWSACGRLLQYIETHIVETQEDQMSLSYLVVWHTPLPGDTRFYHGYNSSPIWQDFKHYQESLLQSPQMPSELPNGSTPPRVPLRVPYKVVLPASLFSLMTPGLNRCVASHNLRRNRAPPSMLEAQRASQTCPCNHCPCSIGTKGLSQVQRAPPFVFEATHSVTDDSTVNKLFVTDHKPSGDQCMCMFGQCPHEPIIWCPKPYLPGPINSLRGPLDRLARRLTPAAVLVLPSTRRRLNETAFPASNLTLVKPSPDGTMLALAWPGLHFRSDHAINSEIVCISSVFGSLCADAAVSSRRNSLELLVPLASWALSHETLRHWIIKSATRIGNLLRPKWAMYHEQNPTKPNSCPKLVRLNDLVWTPGSHQVIVEAVQCDKTTLNLNDAWLWNAARFTWTRIEPTRLSPSEVLAMHSAEQTHASFRLQHGPINVDYLPIRPRSDNVILSLTPVELPFKASRRSAVITMERMQDVSADSAVKGSHSRLADVESPLAEYELNGELHEETSAAEAEALADLASTLDSAPGAHPVVYHDGLPGGSWAPYMWQADASASTVPPSFRQGQHWDDGEFGNDVLLMRLPYFDGRTAPRPMGIMLHVSISRTVFSSTVTGGRDQDSTMHTPALPTSGHQHSEDEKEEESKTEPEEHLVELPRATNHGFGVTAYFVRSGTGQGTIWETDGDDEEMFVIQLQQHLNNESSCASRRAPKIVTRGTLWKVSQFSQGKRSTALTSSKLTNKLMDMSRPLSETQLIRLIRGEIDDEDDFEKLLDSALVQTQESIPMAPIEEGQIVFEDDAMVRLKSQSVVAACSPMAHVVSSGRTSGNAPLSALLRLDPSVRDGVMQGRLFADQTVLPPCVDSISVVASSEVIQTSLGSLLFRGVLARGVIRLFAYRVHEQSLLQSQIGFTEYSIQSDISVRSPTDVNFGVMARHCSVQNAVAIAVCHSGAIYSKVAYLSNGALTFTGEQSIKLEGLPSNGVPMSLAWVHVSQNTTPPGTLGCVLLVLQPKSIVVVEFITRETDDGSPSLLSSHLQLQSHIVSNDLVEQDSLQVLVACPNFSLPAQDTLPAVAPLLITTSSGMTHLCLLAMIRRADAYAFRLLPPCMTVEMNSSNTSAHLGQTLTSSPTCYDDFGLLPERSKGKQSSAPVTPTLPVPGKLTAATVRLIDGADLTALRRAAEATEAEGKIGVYDAPSVRRSELDELPLHFFVLALGDTTGAVTVAMVAIRLRLPQGSTADSTLVTLQAHAGYQVAGQLLPEPGVLDQVHLDGSLGQNRFTCSGDKLVLPVLSIIWSQSLRRLLILRVRDTSETGRRPSISRPQIDAALVSCALVPRKERDFRRLLLHRQLRTTMPNLVSTDAPGVELMLRLTPIAPLPTVNALPVAGSGEAVTKVSSFPTVLIEGASISRGLAVQLSHRRAAGSAPMLWHHIGQALHALVNEAASSGSPSGVLSVGRRRLVKAVARAFNNAFRLVSNEFAEAISDYIWRHRVIVARALMRRQGRVFHMLGNVSPYDVQSSLSELGWVVGEWSSSRANSAPPDSSSNIGDESDRPTCGATPEAASSSMTGQENKSQESDSSPPTTEEYGRQLSVLQGIEAADAAREFGLAPDMSQSTSRHMSSADRTQYRSGSAYSLDDKACHIS